MAKPAQAEGTVPSTRFWLSQNLPPPSVYYDNPNTPCALTADRYNRAIPLLYQYANPRGMISAGSWGCMYDVTHFVYSGTRVITYFYPNTFAQNSIYPQQICPIHSSGAVASLTCTCDNTFAPDAAGTKCVCPPGTQLNAAGSACVEQFTLTLTAPTTIQPSMHWNQKNKHPLFVATNGYELKKATITATVLNSLNNQPKAGVTVSLSVAADVGSGGHIHISNRPNGVLYTTTPPAWACIDAAPPAGCPGAVATATTNAAGVATFTFTAPEAAGKHIFTAKCTSLICDGGTPKTAPLNVMMGDYQLLPSSPFYTITNSAGDIAGGTAGHTENHYATGNASALLNKLGEIYFKEINPGNKLYINDASLPWGGLMDVNDDWKTPHADHRWGNAVDIRANGTNPDPEGEIPFGKFRTVMQKWNERTGVGAEIHCYGKEYTIAKAANPNLCDGIKLGRHFHVKF